MRKRILVLSTLIGVFLSSCGGAKQVNTSLVVKAEESGYKKGYSEGYKEAYKRAYEYEKNLIKLYLELWKRDVLAYEVGKYAVSRGIISYPKIYRTGENSGVGVLETGGQEITPDAVEKLSLLWVPAPYIPSPPKDISVPLPKIENFRSTPYKIGYVKGFKEGVNRGLKEGREKALEEFKEALSSNTLAGKRFYLLELDKYLSSDLKVSAPRIYKLSKGKRVYYYLVPSQVEDVRTPEDVLKGDFPLPEEVKRKEEPQGITLPVQALPYTPPTREIQGEVRAEISCKKLEVVSSYGVGIEVENDRCYAVFSGKEQKEVFCKKTGLCRER